MSLSQSLHAIAAGSTSSHAYKPMLADAHVAKDHPILMLLLGIVRGERPCLG